MYKGKLKGLHEDLKDFSKSEEKACEMYESYPNVERTIRILD